MRSCRNDGLKRVTRTKERNEYEKREEEGEKGDKTKLLKPSDRASVWLCCRIGKRQRKNDRERT